MDEARRTLLAGLNGGRAQQAARPRWSGDPEMWGQQIVGSLSFATSATPALKTFTSDQVLRVEARDLVAVGWDVLVVSTVTGLNETDAGSLALELTIGTGRVTSKFYLLLSIIASGVLAPQNAGAKLYDYFPAANDSNIGVGVIPLPATSVNARVILSIASAVSHDVAIMSTVNIAPRSWVP